MRFAAMLLVAGLCLASAALLSLRAPPGPPLPDFSQWPAGEPRKDRFFAFLRPLLQAENARVLARRWAPIPSAVTTTSRRSGR